MKCMSFTFPSAMCVKGHVSQYIHLFKKNNKSIHLFINLSHALSLHHLSFTPTPFNILLLLAAYPLQLKSYFAY